MSFRTALNEAYSKLDHPHIRQFYGSMRGGSSLYVVFESCEGGEMANMLEDEQPFSELQAGMIIKQLLSVLNYLHKKEMYHGKIHPDFIGFKSFSDGDVMTKLSGFFAKQWDKDRPLTMYDAPEIEERGARNKSDIWSCGVLLCQLLSGKLPFTKRSNFVNPQFEGGSYSAEVLDLLKNMLRFDHRGRPSASEVLAHPWILRWPIAGITSTELRRGITRLREVPIVNPLRATYMRWVVENVLEQEEVERIQKVFICLDSNHNGMLQRDEIFSALRLVMPDDTAQSTASHILPSTSGGIDYSSFLLMAFSTEILSSSSLHKSFLMLSEGSERRLSIKELAKEEQMKQSKKKVRTDGKISFEAFQSFMRSPSNVE